MRIIKRRFVDIFFSIRRGINNFACDPNTLPQGMLGLILNENSFQFKGENYLQTHEMAMGTKMPVSFANIFMAKIETTLIQQSEAKPQE